MRPADAPRRRDFPDPMDPEAKKCRFVLASASPRRRQLLSEAGYDFRVVEPSLPEPHASVSTLAPTSQAEALAYFKARSVHELHDGCPVLGADTIVALGRRVIGKPRDSADARRILESLSGTSHAVITGVALLAGRRRRIASETTHVRMRPMSDAEIGEYIASGEWVDKAGAYAIQETGDRFVARLEGSFSNVVGLPMDLVTKMLAEMEADTPAEPPGKSAG